MTDLHRLNFPGLRLEFAWTGDRWGHRISVPNGNHWHAVLASVEGNPDDPWPPSPALQELRLEPNEHTPTSALLTGRAGRCHFSAALAWRDAPGLLEIDVAARVQRGPVPDEALRSGYVLPPLCDVLIKFTGFAGPCVLVACSSGRLALRPCSGTRALDSQLRRGGKHLFFTPASLPSAIETPLTLRWRYEVDPRCFTRAQLR